MFIVFMALIICSPVFAAMAPGKSRLVQSVGVFSLAMSLVALGLLAFLFDFIMGVSASWIFCAVVIGLAAIAVGVVVLRYRSLAGTCMGILFALSIFTLHLVDLTPVKPYKRFYYAIQNGMTETEVLTACLREFPKNGRFPIPAFHSEANRMSFLLDPTTGTFNAECISLSLHDGKVTQKEYLPD